MSSFAYTLKVERADQLQKAFHVRDCETPEWFPALLVQNTQPNIPLNTTEQVDASGAVTVLDGVYEAARESLYSPNALRAMPFGGSANTNFLMRVWGWYYHALPSGNAAQAVWVPYMIAEFSCWTSDTQVGPFPSVGSGKMTIDQYLCDTIVLVQGVLGTDGWINSTGARDQNGGGSNLPAQLKVCLQGAKYVQFDFKQVDAVRMNCFWAFSS